MSFGLAMAGSATVALLAWRLRSRVPSSRWFAGAALCEALWMGGYVGELVATSLRGKVFWDGVQWLFTAPAAICLWAFATEFSDTAGRHFGRALRVSAALALLVALAVVTEPLHGFIYASARLVPGEPVDGLMYDFGTPVWLVSVWILGLLGIGLAQVASCFGRTHAVYRAQILVVLAGLAIPLAGGLLSVLGAHLGPQRDLSPIIRRRETPWCCGDWPATGCSRSRRSPAGWCSTRSPSACWSRI